MANNEEHQVKEAFEAIHLPEDIAARALESIEAKREQQESERTEGLLTAQENAHANKAKSSKNPLLRKQAATQAVRQKDRGAPLPRNAARPFISPKAGASP